MLIFPSNLYIYKALERAGARLVTVPSPDGITVPIERMLAAITRRAHQMGANRSSSQLRPKHG
jgi:hypothetical protein